MSDTMATLPRMIQRLLDQHNLHAKAIAEIELTLARVNSALSGGNGAHVPKTDIAPAPRAIAPKVKGGKLPASDGKTGNEFVLNFIKTHKSPTSQQINAAWKASGRNRNADITLSLLTKAKKLKRTPLGAGIRGSTYSIT